jgi:hypothetical protein
MTVTEPDINLIKEEIITILKTNADLWQEDNHETGFESMEVGLPTNAVFKGLAYPVLYVTNETTLEQDKPLGAVQAGEIKGSEHNFKFRIIFFDQAEDGQEVEKSLDNFYKLINQTLKENYQLNQVQNTTFAFPTRGHSFNFGEFEGKAIDGRVIILSVQVHTS